MAQEHHPRRGINEYEDAFLLFAGGRPLCMADYQGSLREGAIAVRRLRELARQARRSVHKEVSILICAQESYCALSAFPLWLYELFEGPSLRRAPQRRMLLFRYAERVPPAARG